MRCVACGAVNERGRAYCGYCAHSLGSFCPVCQFLNGDGIRYCGGCARDLLVAVAETVPAPATVRKPPTRAPEAAAVPVPSSTATPATVRNPPTCPPVAAFDDLEDLRCPPVPAADCASFQPTATDTTQEAIDGFFQSLAQKGDVEISSPHVAVQPPKPPRSAPS